MLPNAHVLLITCRHMRQLIQTITELFSEPYQNSKETDREAALEAFVDYVSEGSPTHPVSTELDSNTDMPFLGKQQSQQCQQHPLGPDKQTTSKTNRQKHKSHPDYGQDSTRCTGDDLGSMHVSDSTASRQALQSPVFMPVNAPQHGSRGDGHGHVAKQKHDALQSQVCPAFGTQLVDILSLCHVPDKAQDASCASTADCGVDSVSCRYRVCTVHAFCRTDAI